MEKIWQITHSERRGYYLESWLSALGRIFSTFILISEIFCASASASPPKDYIPTGQPYGAMGVGGGGAMTGFSMSPYSEVWFIGTDMGTLFRSEDVGTSWQPVHHFQTTYGECQLDVDDRIAPVGFSADSRVMFHAPYTNYPRIFPPVRSEDGGIHWKRMKKLQELLHKRGRDGNKIRYWLGDSQRPNVIFAATNNGLLFTDDKGKNWKEADGLQGESVGTFIDTVGEPNTVYHATPVGIFQSKDGGETFGPYHQEPVRWFAGGRDEAGLTLAYIDTDSSACCWAEKEQTKKNCGYVWIQRNGGEWVHARNRQKALQEGGRQIAMAENNSRTIYVVGHNAWEKQYGTKVWVSSDAGEIFDLKFHQYNWDKIPYEPWDPDRLKYSAVALDIDWNDSGYYWFAVNRQNSAMAGGSSNYFLHITRDSGETWESPFTQYADKYPFPPSKGERKYWRSTGLEVISVRKLKFHPRDPKFGLAAGFDHSTLVTEDGGATWRIAHANDNTGSYTGVKYNNSTYDVAFGVGDSTIYIATSCTHDWPEKYYWPHKGEPSTAYGGIFVSTDRGISWEPVFSKKEKHLIKLGMQYPYLSVAYDTENKILYAGTRGNGIFRKRGDEKWEPLSEGFISTDDAHVIPQIEVDSRNGDVYALLTGDCGKVAPNDACIHLNHDKTGIYWMPRGGSQWTLLRGTVDLPDKKDSGGGDNAGRADPNSVLFYPTSFAIDYTSGNSPQTFFLTDREDYGQWLTTGIWRTKDRGKNWERVFQCFKPYHVTIDPNDPQRIYASGRIQFPGQWGSFRNGGAMYTIDGGDTWHRNDTLPLQNVFSVTVDPEDSTKVYYTIFGGGIYYGPRPDLVKGVTNP
ncbi:MAG: hypothetical protein HOC74_08910 [Gemmatimonadetes bacterium]|nr:hypothetical protein [Gemmatimonadota bacterium]MBT7912298.1 hypothetical protein [Candidatus Bathyarchaeota archaeon]